MSQETDKPVPTSEQPDIELDEQATSPSLEEENLEYVPFSDEIQDHQNTDSSAPHPTEDQVRIQLLEDQLELTKDKMIRALADAENSRKRAQKDREEASKFAIAGFSRDLLSVADNLRRALDAISDTADEQDPQLKNLIAGIEATERELHNSFTKNGIKKLIPIDQMFDPNFHEVMFEAPMPDKQTGAIIQVIEPGYTLNERILRPARVGIAKGQDNPEQPIPESGQTINTEV